MSVWWRLLFRSNDEDHTECKKIRFDILATLTEVVELDIIYMYKHVCWVESCNTNSNHKLSIKISTGS